MTFQERLNERKSTEQCTVVLPESGEERILRAAEKLLEEQIAVPVLVGKEEQIAYQAENSGINISGALFVDHTNEDVQENVVENYIKISDLYSRKSLFRKMKKPLEFSALSVAAGLYDCMAAGITYSTGDVINAAGALIGTKEGIKTISSIGIVEVPGFREEENSIFAIADCAVNPTPDSEQLSDIAITSARTIEQLLDIEPRVAMLSFSTKGSSIDISIEKSVEAVKIVNKKEPEVCIDGEFQLDAALLPEIAAKKVPGESKVAGKANVLIFPDLAAGNIAVKTLQIFGHANAHGPLLQGFKKPVTDFSRSANIEEIVGNIKMLTILAGEKE